MCEKVFAYFFRRHVSKKFQEEELEEHLRKMVTASEDIVTTFRNFIDWLKQKVENVPRPEGNLWVVSKELFEYVRNKISMKRRYHILS
jgi:hypothetical protein